MEGTIPTFASGNHYKKIVVRQICGPEVGYEPQTYQIWNRSVSYSTTTSRVFFAQRTVTFHWTHEDSARFQLLRRCMEMWANVHANIIGGMRVFACCSVSSYDDSVFPHVRKINLRQNRSKVKLAHEDQVKKKSRFKSRVPESDTKTSGYWSTNIKETIV